MIVLLESNTAKSNGIFADTKVKYHMENTKDNAKLILRDIESKISTETYTEIAKEMSNTTLYLAPTEAIAN